MVSMENWYAFITDKPKKPESDYRHNDYVGVKCSDCGMDTSIKLYSLKHKLNTIKTYRCRSCGAKYGLKNGGRERYLKTMKERYGVENPGHSEEIKARIKSTTLERYGPGGSTELARAAFEEKYGVTNPFLLAEFQQKAQQTNIEKYGTHNKKNADLLNRNNVESDEQLFEKLVRFIEETGFHCNHPETKAHFGTEGVVLTRLLNRYDRRDLLNIGYFQSTGEKEIHDFIKDGLGYSGTIICGDRKVLSGLEIDVYLPDIKLGIEYNGLYWHSHSVLQDKKKHFDKRVLAEANGIRLLQINEDEWLNKPEIVKSILRNLINKDNKRYYARKLDIRKVDKSTAIGFSEANHLMGAFRTGSHIGLWCGDDLIQILTYRVFKSGELHVERLCSLCDTTVVGGLGKLVGWLINECSPARIVSFVDLRYGSGSSLEQLGFVKEKTTLGFKWTQGGCTFNRRFCRANMDSRGLTQKEHAEELGLDKIYDAGQAKFVLTVSQNQS